MSQNKTVIQGLEPNDSFGKPSNHQSNSFYSRGSSVPSKGTVVPGMMGPQSQNPSKVEESSPRSYAAPQHKPNHTKPVVGFLFSISRTPLGEYWPLVMGKNTIGSSADSDILLAEGTISSNHAVIVTRQVKNGLIAAISDTQSTNGTKINGDMIGFGAEPCNNGDIITIGNNYDCLLVLIDSADLGLKVSEDFLPLDVEETEYEEPDDFPSFDPQKTSHGLYQDNGSQWYSGDNTMRGTVGLNGETFNPGHGGTVPM